MCPDSQAAWALLLFVLPCLALCNPTLGEIQYKPPSLNCSWGLLRTSIFDSISPHLSLSTFTHIYALLFTLPSPTPTIVLQLHFPFTPIAVTSGNDEMRYIKKHIKHIYLTSCHSEQPTLPLPPSDATCSWSPSSSLTPASSTSTTKRTSLPRMAPTCTLSVLPQVPSSPSTG
ncbi:hypothetical protein BKA57DRAFT_256051 [Linnemannia elongata]|nr:hypothetical protein BKA57DRAFT_256051 [Linnemannia elongata]